MMTRDSLQAILGALFGESAGEAEIVARTDRGPVWAFSLSGDYESALENWERLREALSEHELWPLLGDPLGREEDVRHFSEFYKASLERDLQDPRPHHDSEELLRQGLALDADEWLRQRDESQAQIEAERQAWLESQGYSSHEEYTAALEAKERRIEALIAQKCRDGEADEDGEVSFFTEDGGYRTARCGGQHLDLDHDSLQDAQEPEPMLPPERRWQPPASTWILLVPASHGWEVPAMLRFGGWNACPTPQVHVAMIRRWHEKYGAQLIGLTHDIMTFHVARPPQSREEAVPLAREHLYYDGEYDTQQWLTLGENVDGLIGCSRWGFWWD